MGFREKNCFERFTDRNDEGNTERLMDPEVQTRTRGDPPAL